MASSERTPEASRLSAETRAGIRVAWRALWTSRLVVMAGGILAVLEIGRAPGTTGFDPDNLTAPFGYFGNLLVAPLARWDSWWYLTIAQHGYERSQPMRTAFFPLYPLVVRGLGLVVRSDLIAGVVVSLASLAVALVVLYRLALLELGSASRARLTVMLVAFCPIAFFFSAVYSESLFLALSLGAVFAGRMGRWGTAGLLGALAAAERNSGVVLVVPLVLLFLYGPRADRLAVPGPGAGAAWWRRLLPRYPIEPEIAWIALVPVGLLAYLVYLGLSVGDALAPFHVEALWYHHFDGPFGGVYDGIVAAWDGLRQLLHGSPVPVYFSSAGGDPFTVAGQNLMLFGFLILGVVACIGALRRWRCRSLARSRHSRSTGCHATRSSSSPCSCGPRHGSTSGTGGTPASPPRRCCSGCSQRCSRRGGTSRERCPGVPWGNPARRPRHLGRTATSGAPATA